MVVGIGALAVVRLTATDPVAENSPQESVAGLVEKLTQSESSELDPAQMARVVESLIQIVDAEIGERRALEDQLESIRSELDRLQLILGTGGRARSSVETLGQVEQTVDDRLAQAGFSRQQLDILYRREAETQMKRIEIDDLARREGWVNTPRYAEELNDLNTRNSVRANLGDEAYDRYLFAIGRPNRMTINKVFETSPAERAGFQVGDIIQRYGNERVFSSAQLSNLRSSGASGALVAVDILRDGQPMQITLPRGPMGLQGQPSVVDPNN